MAKYDMTDLVIEIDDDVDGSLTDITAHVLEFNGLDVEAVLEESHPFGVSWVEQLFTGLKRGADVTLRGNYDDAAGGPNAILNAIGEKRTFKVTWGSTKTSSMEVLIRNFRRPPVRGEMLKYECVLTITGAVTEA